MMLDSFEKHLRRRENQISQAVTQNLRVDILPGFSGERSNTDIKY